MYPLYLCAVSRDFPNRFVNAKNPTKWNKYIRKWDFHLLMFAITNKCSCWQMYCYCTTLRRFFSSHKFLQIPFWWYCLHVNGPLANFFYLYHFFWEKIVHNSAILLLLHVVYFTAPIAFEGASSLVETTLQLLKISLKDIACHCVKVFLLFEDLWWLSKTSVSHNYRFKVWVIRLIPKEISTKLCFLKML